jgi:hypothetical protein
MGADRNLPSAGALWFERSALPGIEHDGNSRDFIEVPAVQRFKSRAVSAG